MCVVMSGEELIKRPFKGVHQSLAGGGAIEDQNIIPERIGS